MASSLTEEDVLYKGCVSDFAPEPSMEPDLMQALSNMRLNDTLRIDKLIERENAPHANIYSVFDEKSNCLADSIEAHVFILDDAQPKIRKHRLRCIKRMEGRTILRKGVHNAEVVVITTSSSPSGNIPDRQDNADTDWEGLDASPVPHMRNNSDRHKKQKTPYQREVARIGQRERRNARRLNQRRQRNSEVTDVERGSEVSSRELRLDGDDTQFSMDLILLYMAYDDKGNLRQHITQEHSALLKSMRCDRLQDLLTTYLDDNSIEFTTPEDMEAFLRVKQSELISLRLQEKKMPSIESFHHEKCLKVIREQSQHAKDSVVWRTIQQGPRAHAMFQLKAVRHAKAVLPVALKRLESIYNSIAHRLSLVRDTVATKKGFDEWKRLSDNVAKCEKWMIMVFPTSSAYEELRRQWESAKRELESYENSHPGLTFMDEAVDSLLRMTGTR
ncbi:hypothetical protein VMCG_03266 [Cytospora schulzeri]|uniref:Uncharacterized protein n=1 Tax=Cytospora schulzeri TaxID=448051 RepID=A0A423WXZ0_9PEZI|nr:hypothetical protein VMCG_03266 [Valsa malicola]